MAFAGKTLTVYLAADTAKLRAGLNSADRSLSGFGNKLSGLIGPALIGATAAAGAFAVALAVDSVQAAMAEEAELAKLNTTLENLGFSGASDQISTFIDDMQFATGVSDSELRPSMQRLLVSTGNVAQAQNLLNVAVNTSIGTGKSLESVANALGKAYDGNFGALSKLNAGIDSSIIKSKDLDGAVAQLSSTFGGQAAARAQTLEGQIKILNIAFDELKEALGKGLIEGFTTAGGGINNLSVRMRDLQPQTEDLGRKAGTLASNLLDAALGAKELADRGNDLLQGILSYGGPAFQLIGNAALDALNPIGQVINSLSGVNKALNPSGANGGVKSFGTGGAMARAAAAARDAKAAIDGTTTAQDNLSNSTGKVAKATQEMNPRLRAQIDLVKQLTSSVDDAGKALDSARKEMNAWISSMAGSITSEINLGTAFDAMFNAEGEKTGQSLLDGFNKQIDQAGIFGSYLKKLNSEGGPELRDAVAKLGPEAGNKLAKEIIDQGLIPTMQSKLVDVQSMAEQTAAEMVPPMLVAGVASAAGYLMNMQAELEESTTMLEEMGRRMGKTLSEAMVKEIRDALAAAGVAQSGASATIAGTATGPGMAQAQLIAGNPLMNGTAIMQAIQNAILQSDQRLGRTGQVLNA
jgi:hypothetical protein